MEWECILKSRQEVRNQTNPGKYLETRRDGQVSFVNCRQKGISHSMDNKQVLIEVSHLTHIYETEGEAPFYALRDVSLQN